MEITTNGGASVEKFDTPAPLKSIFFITTGKKQRGGREICDLLTGENDSPQGNVRRKLRLWPEKNEAPGAGRQGSQKKEVIAR